MNYPTRVSPMENILKERKQASMIQLLSETECASVMVSSIPRHVIDESFTAARAIWISLSPHFSAVRPAICHDTFPTLVYKFSSREETKFGKVSPLLGSKGPIVRFSVQWICPISEVVVPRSVSVFHLAADLDVAGRTTVSHCSALVLRLRLDLESFVQAIPYHKKRTEGPSFIKPILPRRMCCIGKHPPIHAPPRVEPR